MHVFCCVLALTLCGLPQRELTRHGVQRSIPALLDALGGDPRGQRAVPGAGGGRRARTPDDALADDQTNGARPNPGCGFLGHAGGPRYSFASKEPIGILWSSTVNSGLGRDAPRRCRGRQRILGRPLVGSPVRGQRAEVDSGVSALGSGGSHGRNCATVAVPGRKGSDECGADAFLLFASKAISLLPRNG